MHVSERISQKSFVHKFPSSQGPPQGTGLGVLVSDGTEDGWPLGMDDGCDVGKTDADGVSEGWSLGRVLNEGDLLGAEDGRLERDGAILGIEPSEGVGRPEIDGVQLGTNLVGVVGSAVGRVVGGTTRRTGPGEGAMLGESATGFSVAVLVSTDGS